MRLLHKSLLNYGCASHVYVSSSSWYLFGSVAAIDKLASLSRAGGGGGQAKG